MVGARVGAAAVAILMATAVDMSSPGVADADDCGGFGPGIAGSDNCGPNGNNTSGGNNSVYSTWPPGMDWGFDDDGADNATPIVPVP